jgi:hypothetical protein
LHKTLFEALCYLACTREVAPGMRAYTLFTRYDLSCEYFYKVLDVVVVSWAS